MIPVIGQWHVHSALNGAADIDAPQCASEAWSLSLVNNYNSNLDSLPSDQKPWTWTICKTQSKLFHNPLTSSLVQSRCYGAIFSLMEGLQFQMFPKLRHCPDGGWGVGSAWIFWRICPHALWALKGDHSSPKSDSFPTKVFIMSQIDHSTTYI